MSAGPLAMRVATFVAFFLFTLATRAADDFPRGPIRLVVPFAPGGSTDTLARTIGQKLTETWGKQVVVDNRAESNGILGLEDLKNAPADG